MSEPLGPGQSTHELLRAHSQEYIDRHDLVTPTPAEHVLGLAERMNVLDIIDLSDDSKARLSMLPEPFRVGMRNNLAQLIGDGTSVTGMSILRAYEHTVETVAAKNSRQLPQHLFIIDAYANLFNYFGIPVTQQVIDKEQSRDPRRAQEYEERAQKWSNPQ